MKKFLEKYHEDVNGSLSGFDRIVIRGTYRSLSVKSGMLDLLWRAGVLLKDFAEYAKNKTDQLKQAVLNIAGVENRPAKYLQSPKESKEKLAKNLAEKDGIKKGLICFFTTVEECKTFKIFRDKIKKLLSLEPKNGKCMHIYKYFFDPVFGFMSARIQTWFPFNMQICINGREWLSRQLDKAGIKYERRENCFAWIEDIKKAQRLMDKQLEIDWVCEMNRIAEQLNPGYKKMFEPYKAEYYWTMYQSEWATDIMFKSEKRLAEVYEKIVRAGISIYGSKDIMRFLGMKPNGNFKGEVISKYLNRPEGICVKHKLKQNSIKIYDKQGKVLRVETTINDPGDFKAYRPIEGQDPKILKWQKLRKSVAGAKRRAEVSQLSNNRYLEAISEIDTEKQLGEIIADCCKPVRWKGKSIRALNPLSEEDRKIIETISLGEFAIRGFRNKDLQPFLYPQKKKEEKVTGKVTYKIRILRAHKIIRKISGTNRYELTKKGKQISAIIMQTKNINIKELMQIAA